jgi:hypothetical protein
VIQRREGSAEQWWHAANPRAARSRLGGLRTGGGCVAGDLDQHRHRLELGVNSKGEALLTYTSKGKVVHVLAWGAINAIPPTRGVEQVAFKLDYSGGFDKYYNQDPAVQKLRMEFSKIRYTPGLPHEPVTKHLQHASAVRERLLEDGWVLVRQVRRAAARLARDRVQGA